MRGGCQSVDCLSLTYKKKHLQCCCFSSSGSAHGRGRQQTDVLPPGPLSDALRLRLFMSCRVLGGTDSQMAASVRLSHHSPYYEAPQLSIVDLGRTGAVVCTKKSTLILPPWCKLT